MQEKNLVEEAFIQLNQVKDAMSKNAQGILSSVMKEEIKELVKESLSEQEEDELDVDTDSETDDVEMDADDTEMDADDTEMDVDVDDEVETDMDTDVDSLDMDSEEPIDLTNASDEEILKVFKHMGEDDGIIVKKDGNDIHLSDNSSDSEYIVKLGESKINKKLKEQEMDNYEMSEDETEDIINQLFSDEDSDTSMEGENMSISDDEDMSMSDDEVMYEIEFDSDEEMSESDEEEEEMSESDEEEEEMSESDEEEEEMSESDEEEEEMSEGWNEEEEMSESDEEEIEESDEEEMDESEEEDLEESYDFKKSIRESKKSTTKPKGVGIGSGPKFSYKKSSGGFDEKKKQGPKSVGTGSAKKFKFGKGENTSGKMKTVKKTETKEAARTYGFGRKTGGAKFKKGITNNRNLKTEALEAEVKLLRQKNEEYRKALNVFREKLNEVAIFNSNLAYSTRLFTEHSTTKKEKINILRRFDGVETLKESKNLYRIIKDELSKGETKSLNESVEHKINKTVTTGSATTLIESKTYENPQFMRIKDLISKIG